MHSVDIDRDYAHCVNSAVNALDFGSSPRRLALDVFTFIAILIVGGPIAKAVAKRISGQPVAGGAELRDLQQHTEQRLDETEHRLADTTERLADMEERLDFTERLLARQNAREQLRP